MSVVQLHRDSIAFGGEHVLELPAWIPPSRHPLAAYWHQPRSAYRADDGRLIVHLWCGQGRYYAAGEPVLDLAPPNELRCGTCIGRRLGYDRDQGAIFQPVDHWALPARCPSTTPDPNDLRLCFACGRPTNAARGWWSYGLAMHGPGPALADRFEPCPLHGWQRIETRQEPLRLVCGFFSCEHVA